MSPFHRDRFCQRLRLQRPIVTWFCHGQNFEIFSFFSMIKNTLSSLFSFLSSGGGGFDNTFSLFLFFSYLFMFLPSFSFLSSVWIGVGWGGGGVGWGWSGGEDGRLKGWGGGEELGE